MAKKPSITTISSGYASTTTLNDNFEALKEAFDNTLSRDGSTPNTMGADLDMNGNDIVGADRILVGGVDYLAQSLAHKNAAATSEANAATSKTNAATSESNAATSATNASTSASSASTSASNASTSATTATTKATEAATSATNASTSETNAATSETNAATSETNAATSATNAATSATNAATSATSAATSATNAAASYDAFDDRYLGSKSTAPTTDNDGDALITGALYYNSTAEQLYVWNGSAWDQAAFSVSGAVTSFNTRTGAVTLSSSDISGASGLLSTNNLSDLGDAATARTNLGLGTAATTASTDYATAAQGTLADNALPTSGGTLTGNVNFGDNDKAIFGAGSDLQIYHDGSNSWIRDEGTGSLYIRGSTELALQSSTGDNYLQAISDGTTRLFYDHSEKFATTSTGVSITGNVDIADNSRVNFGTGNDLQIYHTGLYSFISDQGTGGLYIDTNGSEIALRSNTGSENMLVCQQNGAVTAYYDNATKFATTSTGVDITGTLVADGIDIQGDGTLSGGSRITVTDIADVNNDGIRFDDNTTSLYNNLSQDTSGNFVLQHYTGSTWQNNLTISTGGNLTVAGTAIAATNTDTTNTGSVTLDFGANQNFVLTLTGNVTLANPSTEVVGQSGFIVFIQDATGGRTVSLGTDYETAGGAGLTLSSAASTTDVVPYIVAASGRILLGAPQLAFA